MYQKSTELDSNIDQTIPKKEQKVPKRYFL